MTFLGGGASQYHVSRIKVVFTSKLRKDLEMSIENLRRSEVWRLRKSPKDFLKLSQERLHVEKCCHARDDPLGALHLRRVEGSLERLNLPYPWVRGFLRYARNMELYKEPEVDGTSGSTVLANPELIHDTHAKWYTIPGRTPTDYIVLPSDDAPVWAALEQNVVPTRTRRKSTSSSTSRQGSHNEREQDDEDEDEEWFNARERQARGGVKAGSCPLAPRTEIKRLQRRAWRISYLKSPHNYKKAVRHYIFHDWRYEFQFWNPPDAEQVVSRILGSCTPDTSSVVHFSWHFAGENPSLQTASPRLLEEGRQGVLQQVQQDEERRKGWYHHTTFWNNAGKSGSS